MGIPARGQRGQGWGEPGPLMARAYDEATGRVLLHIHASAGLKAQSATGHTSHLVGTTIQVLTEMYVVEVAGPAFSRQRKADLDDVPLLSFDG
ncbi:hypothetical protein GCM10029976_009940 [Kribbella albertanoniae]